MTTWKLIRLNFGRNFAHFGDVGIGLETSSERVRSDTLFSAWMSSYARLFGQHAIEGLLHKLTESTPPFRHSSTFIYQQKGTNNPVYTYYLPKPLYFPLGYPVGNDLSFTKTYKKQAYLPLSVWQRWYQGEGFISQDQEELEKATKNKPNKNGKLYQEGLFDYSTTFKYHNAPKVAIDRLTHSTNFFHTRFVQFQLEPEQHSGLYFLLKLEETSLENVLHAALRFLGEEGLGGERSSGAGRFEVTWIDLPEEWQAIINFKDNNYYSLMSLFWDDSLTKNTLENAYYEMRERGGWITASYTGQQLRRKMIRMFTEGSIFPFLPQGKLANVTPKEFNKHQIYRSGISLSLPITIASPTL